MNLKYVLVLEVFCFCVYCVSAFELGVSPPNLEFRGLPGELLCDYVKIDSSSYSSLVLDDLWSDSIGKREIGKYNLPGDYFGVISNYSKEFVVYSVDEIPVCFVFEKPGRYNGVLLMGDKYHRLSLGVWIGAEIYGTPDDVFDEEIGKISLGSEEISERGNYGLFFSALIQTLLLGTFLVVLRTKLREMELEEVEFT